MSYPCFYCFRSYIEKDAKTKGCTCIEGWSILSLGNKIKIKSINQRYEIILKNYSSFKKGYQKLSYFDYGASKNIDINYDDIVPFILPNDMVKLCKRHLKLQAFK